MLSSASLSLLPLALLASLAEASTNHIVTVGKGGLLVFDPPGLTAAVGDTVTYQFFAKNHSVVQSSFTDPCHPLDGGFFSGFTPQASADVASTTTFTITINDTSKPIWAYCSQTNGDHCQKGMVHAINAKTDGSNTLELFKQAASQASTSTSPASPKPVGGQRVKTVGVGSGTDLVFVPNNFTELAGTIVQFSFNPKNHSVVQSSFGQPCQPLADGFSSGFVPTAATPSGATFEIVVPDDGKPIWFYCAQTNNNHCQTGMVGSINAPAAGANTFDEFVTLAKKAPPSTIPPQAPLKGTFKFNNNEITSFNGAVFTGGNSTANSTSPSLGGTTAPPPGQNTTSQEWGMAGGASPNSYNWAQEITANATNGLRLLGWLDNILLEVLYDGYAKLNDGEWKGIYPKSIVDTIGSLAAQALVHRSTSTDSLQHYQKPIAAVCQYNLHNSNVDDFLSSTLALLLLEIGVLIDISALVGAADPWLVPVLTTQVGAKARMTAVVNMMQNHLAAAAVREVMMPAELAYSYAHHKFVQSCPDKLDGMPETPYPELTISNQARSGAGQLTQITVQLDASTNQGDHWIAWVGSWGNLQYTKVNSDGTAAVPTNLYGHVWAVLVSKDGGKLQEIAGVTVAGPEMVWVNQPA